MTRSDLLVINKIDLADHVGASLEVMDRDSRLMRGNRPFVFTNLKDHTGLDAVVSWIRHELLYDMRCTIARCIVHLTVRRFELLITEPRWPKITKPHHERSS